VICYFPHDEILGPFLLIAVSGWMNQEQFQLIDYLRGENQVLREQSGQKRLSFNGDQRRRLAAKAKGLGKQASPRGAYDCHDRDPGAVASPLNRAEI